MMPVDHCFYIYSSGTFGWIVPSGDGVKVVNVWASGLDPKNLLSVLHDAGQNIFYLFLPSSVVKMISYGKHKNYTSLSNG